MDTHWKEDDERGVNCQASDHSDSDRQWHTTNMSPTLLFSATNKQSSSSSSLVSKEWTSPGLKIHSHNVFYMENRWPDMASLSATSITTVLQSSLYYCEIEQTWVGVMSFTLDTRCLAFQNYRQRHRRAMGASFSLRKDEWLEPIWIIIKDDVAVYTCLFRIEIRPIQLSLLMRFTLHVTPQPADGVQATPFIRDSQSPPCAMLCELRSISAHACYIDLARRCAIFCDSFVSDEIAYT